MSIFDRNEAIAYLELDDKTFDNYFRSADEFSCLPREGDRGRFYFNEDDLRTWLQSYRWRTIELTIEDYALCLDFALAQHSRGYVLSDFGTGRQREFGQKVTNWVKGQLGEVAVKKFFQSEFGVDVELDFEIHNGIVPQDIIGIAGRTGMRKPKIDIAIKSSKPKSCYLVLSPAEVERADRKSDFYIFCRPDIPDDHLLRITRDAVLDVVNDQQHFDKYKDQIPGFENIPCEIAGYCSIDELEIVEEIPGQDFDGIRYIKKTGDLHRNEEEWEELLNQI